MITEVDRKLFDLLLQEKELILSEWLHIINNENEEPFINEIKENGIMVLDLLINSYLSSKVELESLIENHAILISEQLVIRNSNIGGFVYNINIIRTITFKHIHLSDIDLSTNKETISLLNWIFNQYLHRTVTLYTEEKNRIIEEKTQFIDSSHKDRLTLLGQMTSSFIHEFRNPLTSVQGFIQLLKADYPDMRYLDIISNELEQLNFRISQFLLLSKKELIGKEKNIFSLNKLVEEVLLFLYPSILDGNVKITQEMQESVYICGFADEIRQVLINIIFNAIDVLSPYRSDGKIEISCSTINSTSIQLDIGNNGPMIPENLIHSIFEPFVTTKKLGTGLGLFVCREIIEKHRGTLTCSSSKEKTIFRITLPLAKHSL